MHTRLWVWLQAVSAVVVALVGDVRSHPILAARGVVFGLLLRVAHMALWSQLWRYVNPVIGAAVRGAGLRACGGFIVTGADAVAAIPGWIAIGWLIACFHRSRLVLLYVLTTWCLALPDDWRQISDAIDDARFRPYLILHLAGLVVFTLSVLAGALANNGAHRHVA